MQPWLHAPRVTVPMGLAWGAELLAGIRLAWGSIAIGQRRKCALPPSGCRVQQKRLASIEVGRFRKDFAKFS